MGHGTGWASAGAGALWLATAFWTQAVLAQGTTPLQPLKPAGGRFEIIAGGDAARGRTATPAALAAPGILQPLPRPLAPPLGATTEAQRPPHASPSARSDAPVPAVARTDGPSALTSPAAPAISDGKTGEIAAADPATAGPEPGSPVAARPTGAEPVPAASPEVAAPAARAEIMAAAPIVDPIITGAVPAPASQTRTVLLQADDNVKIVIGGNALMSEALRRARASVDAFLKTAAQPPAGASGFAVKVLVGPKEAREALWLSALERRVQPNLLFGSSERWSGRLANAPTDSTTLRVGDRISFEASDIRDWTYFVAGGRPVGNFTACALTAPEGPARLAALVEKTGLDCGWIEQAARTAAR